MAYETIRAIAYDLDGTILDTIPYKLAQNQYLATQFGRELTSEQVRHIWNASSGFVDLMTQICGTDDMAVIMPIVERDYNKLEFQKRQFPFTGQVLDDTSLGGRYKTALVTNATRQILRLDSDSLGLRSFDAYFDFTQTAEECEFKKPDPRVFEQMLRHLGYSAANVVYFGDELKDAEAAHAAGLQFIGVETGLATKQEFAAQGIVSVATLPDALQLIEHS